MGRDILKQGRRPVLLAQVRCHRVPAEWVGVKLEASGADSITRLLFEPRPQVEIRRPESAVVPYPDLPVASACEIEQQPGLGDPKHHGFLEQHVGSAAQRLVRQGAMSFRG